MQSLFSGLFSGLLFLTDFSRIRNANIGRFTVDRLMTVLGRLDQRVDVNVKVRRKRRLSRLKGAEKNQVSFALPIGRHRARKNADFAAFAQSRDAWTLNQFAAIPIAQFYIPKTEENDRKLIADREFRGYWTGALRPQGQAAAMAWDIALCERFFHWFLEFPEIIARGGFDCILGNPPYLGGQALSGTYGYPFCTYVKWSCAPAGLSDLVVYFVRRIFGAA